MPGSPLICFADDEDVTPELLQLLRECVPPGFTLSALVEVDKAERPALLSAADFILLVNGGLDADTLTHRGSVQLIQKTGSGYDRIDVAAADRGQEVNVAGQRLVPFPASHLPVACHEVRSVTGPREVRSLHDGKRFGTLLSGQVMVEEVSSHEGDITRIPRGVVEIPVMVVAGNNHRMAGVDHQRVVSDLPAPGKRLGRRVGLDRYSNGLSGTVRKVLDPV